MASRRYCSHCRRYRMAQWSYNRPPEPLTAFVVLASIFTLGLFFPFGLLILAAANKSGYVCPVCTERV